MNATPLELDAVLFSRILKDGERVFVGANLPAIRAGAVLAVCTHAPRLRLAQALAWMDVPPTNLRSPGPGIDVDDAARAEMWIRDYEIYDDVARIADVFVIGGFEIDRYGNSNLVGVPRPGGWSRRGPGPVGTTSMAVIAPRIVLYSTSHSPDTLVERCSAISALGWGDGDTRHRLGIAVPGPELCLTPAGIFDFPPPLHQMRLVALRPGWTLQRAREMTAFPLHEGVPVATIAQPTPTELQILRTKVDPEGALRG
jgi:glutaconate CoA-transferase, subunit B